MQSRRTFILQPQPSGFWGESRMPPCQVYVGLGLVPRVLHMLGRLFPSSAAPPGKVVLVFWEHRKDGSDLENDT